MYGSDSLWPMTKMTVAETAAVGVLTMMIKNMKKHIQRTTVTY